jgi:hypothetical protein
MDRVKLGMGAKGKDIILLAIEDNIELDCVFGTHTDTLRLAVNFIALLAVHHTISKFMIVHTILSHHVKGYDHEQNQQ